jgi:ribonuclease HI
MPPLFRDELENISQAWIKILAENSITGKLLPHSFRDYTCKVQVIKDGRSFGNINLYYSPKNDSFSMKGHELKDDSIMGELETYWTTFLAENDGNKKVEDGGIIAYVDGSSIEDYVSYGLVIIDNNQILHKTSGLIKEESLQSMNQIGGEITSVYEAIKWAEGNKIQKLTIAYDYEGLEKWATGEWNANNSTTLTYQEDAKNWQVDITWQKIESHSGDPWNDKADQLAKQAIPRKQESITSSLSSAESLANDFVSLLSEKGIDAKYNGILNNMFARISISNGGFLDIYATGKRDLHDPYIHGFSSEIILEHIKESWIQFIGKTTSENNVGKDEEKAELLDQLERIYQDLLPYRDMEMDFSVFGESLKTTYDLFGLSCSILRDQIDNFDHLEAEYKKLLEALRE